MSQENLESFILMSVEKEMLTEINFNDVIDIIATRSEALKNKLMY